MKLFSDILASSVWDEDDGTRIVWITLLAMADEDGFVHTTDAALARFARVTDVTLCDALRVLSSEDGNSRSDENGGKRIENVPGGFMILNYSKYRNFKTAREKREDNRQRVARHRARRNACNAPVTNVTHSEADADAEAEAEADKRTSTDTQDEITKTWNETLPAGFPRIAVFGKERKTALRARFAEPFFRDNWRAALAKIPGSPFLSGENDRGWRANIDWFLRPGNVVRLMEGGYDKSGKLTPQEFAEKLSRELDG